MYEVGDMGDNKMPTVEILCTNNELEKCLAKPLVLRFCRPYKSLCQRKTRGPSRGKLRHRNRVGRPDL